MPRVSEEHIARKKDEILDACGELYARSAFKDVTMKDIAERTSLSRPSIYNYFQTVEEIFLGLLEREYDRWAVDLEKIRDGYAVLDCEALASEIAYSLERRKTLLRIQSTNLYEIEDGSRLELLIEFKRAMRRAIDAFDGCLGKFMPQMGADRRTALRLAFFPFMYGLYPYAEPTEKQCRAMDATQIPHPATSIYELAKGCLRLLLG